MPNLSRQTLNALEAAQALTARDLALGDLIAELDPQRDQALFTLAGVIVRMLSTHATALNRIEAGARPARTDIERSLLTLRQTGCPTSQRRCYDLLQDLLG